MTLRRVRFDGASPAPGRGPADGVPTRRPRRPDDGRFLAKDAAAWARLVEASRRAARNPDRHVAALQAASRMASRAVPAPGYGGRDGPFLRLLLSAVKTWATTGEARAFAAQALGDLAEQVADALARTAEAERETPARRDVFG